MESEVPIFTTRPDITKHLRRLALSKPGFSEEIVRTEGLVEWTGIEFSVSHNATTGEFTALAHAKGSNETDDFVAGESGSPLQALDTAAEGFRLEQQPYNPDEEYGS